MSYNLKLRQVKEVTVLYVGDMKNSLPKEDPMEEMAVEVEM
jgi:hypothetical protein